MMATAWRLFARRPARPAKIICLLLAAMAWIADGIQLAACKTLATSNQAKKSIALGKAGQAGTDKYRHTRVDG